MTDWIDELIKVLNSAQAIIRKNGSSKKPYCVYSKTGKKLGCYATEKEAIERLSQIHYFENKGEDA